MIVKGLGGWSEHLLITKGLGRSKPRETITWEFEINKNDDSLEVDKNKDSKIVDVET